MIRCCKDCPDRRLACPDTCPRYQAEKAAAEAEKKAARRKKAVKEDYIEYRKGTRRRRTC